MMRLSLLGWPVHRMQIVMVEMGIIRWQDICEAIKLFQIMHSLSAVTRLFISIKRYPGIYVQAIRAMMCLLDKVGCFMMTLFLLLLSFVQTVICKKCRFVFLQLLKTK